MKNKIILSLLITSNILFAQKQYVGLAIGPSFPSGNYSETNLSDSTSGFAKTGLAVEFTYAYNFTHYFGLQAIINYGSNTFDYQNYQNQLELAHPGYDFAIEVARNWSSGGVLVGPFISLPLNENLSWDLKGLFGIYSAYSPAFLLYISDSLAPGAPPEEFSFQFGSAYNYGYLISTGFKYKLSNYYVLLFGDYISSPLKFKDASSWDWNSEPYSINFNQTISFYTLTLGIGYYF